MRNEDKVQPWVEIKFWDEHYGLKHITIDFNHFAQEEDDFTKKCLIQTNELNKILNFYTENFEYLQKEFGKEEAGEKFLECAFDGEHFKFPLSKDTRAFHKTFYSALLHLGRHFQITLDDIAFWLSQEIKKLPPKTKFTFGEFLDKYHLSYEENFSVCSELKSRLKDKISRMDTDEFLGCPWEFTYIINEEETVEWDNLFDLPAEEREKIKSEVESRVQNLKDTIQGENE